MNSRHIAALRYWVTEESRNYRRNKNGDTVDKEKKVGERIQEILNYMHPLNKELIVYRGHKDSPSYISPRNWFSTSLKHSIAKNEYSGKECCTFEIHVQPGIQILNVNKFLKEKDIVLDKYKDEHEIIINGGGEFFKDSEKSEPGFFTVSEGHYCTYYFPKRVQLNSKRILERIPEEEYEFIRNISNIKTVIGKNETANNSTLQSVLNTITAARNKGE
jgi:hypothetical protein